METRIRSANADDLAALRGLYAQLQPNDPPWASDEAAAAQLAHVLAHPGITILLAETGGRAVATCMLIVSPNFTREGRPFAMIENVVTDREHRQRGYGRLVVQRAIEIARAQNCYRVTLMTGSKREETLSFYETTGLRRGTKTAFEARFL
jgi:GNAT superfamily N-acetyltransferase